MGAKLVTGSARDGCPEPFQTRCVLPKCSCFHRCLATMIATSKSNREQAVETMIAISTDSSFESLSIRQGELWSDIRSDGSGWLRDQLLRNSTWWSNFDTEISKNQAVKQLIFPPSTEWRHQHAMFTLNLSVTSHHSVGQLPFGPSRKKEVSVKMHLATPV